jgi:methionyl aminopeptidase
VPHLTIADTPPLSNATNNVATGRNGPAPGDGDGCLGSNGAAGGSDDDDDDGIAQAETSAVTPLGPASTSSNSKKKKKRSKSKKSKNASPKQQTSPPSIPVANLYPAGSFLPRQLLEYPSFEENTKRTTQAELRALSQPNVEDLTFLNDYRHAAEVHRQTRAWIRKYAKPGTSLTKLASGIDDSIRALLNNPGLEPGSALRSGMGFPTGLCINEVAAHWTPNPGGKDVLLSSHDVLSVDFGVHINGWIVDSAFTMSWDPVYDDLLKAVREATEAGIKVKFYAMRRLRKTR